MTPVEPGVKVPQESVTSDTNVTPADSSAKTTKTRKTRKADAAPKKRAARPVPESSSDLTTAELEDALAQLLTFPAVPCSVMGDEWAANHFSTNGRTLAGVLAQQAEKNEAVRKWCYRMAQGETVGMLAMASLMYVFPPLVHWGLIPLPNEARAMIPGMPPPTATETTEGTAASHMAEPGYGSNGNNGSQTGTRQERHTP